MIKYKSQLINVTTFNNDEPLAQKSTQTSAPYPPSSLYSNSLFIDISIQIQFSFISVFKFTFR